MVIYYVCMRTIARTHEAINVSDKRYMRLTTRLATFALLFLLGIVGIAAQSVTQQTQQKSLMGIEVHFRFDKSDLDLSYMDNEQSLTRFAHVIDSIGLFKIDSIVVVSQSSPEGSYEHNIRLSQRRAATMRRTIEHRHPELKELLRIHPDGESWLQLREYVANDTVMSRQSISEVLAVIDSDVNIATKKRRMQQLDTYSYLYKTYYPRIRNSVFCIVYYNLHTTVVPLDKLLYHAIEPAPVPTDTILPALPLRLTERVEQKSLLAVKTNLVNDALLSPSIELEYRFAPHWSVVADYSIAWWKRTEVHWYYQLMQFNPELRYWFRTDSFWRGHYVGIFVGAGYYDLENGYRGYKGEHILSGLSYGYMFPIGKRLSLDAGIGIGAMVTEYEEYLPMDGHYVYQQTSRTRYFGPLKLRLALTWCIDHQKLNKALQWMKGGKP